MPRPFTKALICCLAVLAPAGWALAQEPADAPAEASAPAAESDAVSFLREIEEANEGVKTLRGEFTQIRTNKMFLEEIRSEGEFWYAKPNRFRCDYKTPTLSRFYLLGDEGLYYTPELNQLEVLTFEGTDGDAPINQMLVGFGLDTDQILKVFTVIEAPSQPQEENLYALEFISKDLQRSMEFRRIVVTFDREELQPVKLFMEQEEDTVEVFLEVVEANAPIDDSKFARDFGDDVEVIEY